MVDVEPLAVQPPHWVEVLAAEVEALSATEVERVARVVTSAQLVVIREALAEQAELLAGLLSWFPMLSWLLPSKQLEVTAQLGLTASAATAAAEVEGAEAQVGLLWLFHHAIPAPSL